jgi:hypothetical protein
VEAGNRTGRYPPPPASDQSTNGHRLLMQAIRQAENALHDRENAQHIPDFTKGNLN